MPNYEGNNAIAVYGQATRFGAGNCPRAARAKASPPWSIRNAVRELAGVEVDIRLPVTVDLFLRTFDPMGSKHATGAEIAAAQYCVLALTGNNYRMLDRLTDMIDGPLPKEKVKAEPSLAELIADIPRR
jgi:hypothetical protein